MQNTFDYSDLKKTAGRELAVIKKDNVSNVPRMGALCNATIKRFRGLCVANFIQDVVIEHDLDITFTLADQLAREVLGHGVNANILMRSFATPNRTAANKVSEENREIAFNIVREHKKAFMKVLSHDTQWLKELTTSDPDDPVFS